MLDIVMVAGRGGNIKLLDIIRFVTSDPYVGYCEGCSQYFGNNASSSANYSVTFYLYPSIYPLPLSTAHSPPHFTVGSYPYVDIVMVSKYFGRK